MVGVAVAVAVAVAVGVVVVVITFLLLLWIDRQLITEARPEAQRIVTVFKVG